MRRGFGKFAWFVGIWLPSVACIGTVAFLIRLWIV